MKAREFDWPQERMAGLVANRLKGKKLEAYAMISVEIIMKDDEELRA